MFSVGEPRPGRWMDTILVSALGSSVGLLLIGLLSWQNPFGGRLQLSAGEVAPQNVVAPLQITYESQVLTERARERAAASVADQFDAPDARVRRQQVERAREVLDYITVVRSDELASLELKTDYLIAIVDFTLTPETALEILNSSDEDWAAIVAEVPSALDRILREEIRENNLGVIRRRIPAFLDPNLNEHNSVIVTELMRGLIRPNSLFNEARTDELRERARAEVASQPVTLERNEVIVRAGDVVTPESVESMTQIGLLQDDWNWWVALRAFFYTVLLMTVVAALLYRLYPQTLMNLQELSLLVVTVMAWLLAAKFMIVPHDWLPYLYPMAALGMLLAVLLDLRVSLIITVAMSLLVYYLAQGNVGLVAYACLGSLVGGLILGRAERLTVFIWAAVGVAVSNVVALAAFQAPFMDMPPSRLFQLTAVTLLNGGLSASVALLGYFLLGNLFGITTSLQLTELSRPTHPLLRQLLLKASGTYHHTIVVSNLAERAAAAIGADAYLTRVGAYYHDIGKTVRPYFFAENMADSASPHDKLDALTSAQIIISHVSDGIDLANKYRLPARIQDFIREHHGRSLVRYFYMQAQEEAEGEGSAEPISEADFRYLGPSPRSKETAILLLADTCEAAVRAVRPATREDLEALVTRLIDERLAEGELNHCNLTFRELQTTKEIFLQVLQGVHHPRIQYPEPVSRKVKAPVPLETRAREEVVAGVERPNSERSGSGSPLPLPGGVEKPAGV